MSARWRRRFRLFGPRAVEEDVEREIRAHLAFRAEELERAGWSEEAARVEADRLFGDRAAIEQQCRRVARRHESSMRRTMMWGEVLQDVRYAVRSLVKSPGFTAAAVVTLAVGIGANSGIFSVVNGVLLAPLPYDEPEALVDVRETTNRGGTMAVAWANFVDWREESDAFEALAAYQSFGVTVLGGERPLRLPVARVSADFWRTLRIVPSQGRLTTPEEHLPEAPPVVVVSSRLWQNELGGLPLDRISLEIMGLRARVVGVTPAGFDFPGGVDLWMAAEPAGNTSRTSHNWRVIGRLPDPSALDAAAREMDALTKAIVLREPDADSDFLAVGATLIPMRERIVGASRTPLVLLMGAAGLVLLVACTNLASTLLARGTTRARELAIRSSLGAQRTRIVRQLLTESLVLSALGGVAAIGVAYVTTATLRRIGPAALPRVEGIGVDGTVVAFTALVAVASTLLFGLLPAVRLTRRGASTALRSGARGSSGDHRGPVWRLLVGTEVALALVLLTGSGLLVRSFQELLSEDLGFDGADVVTSPLALSMLEYETPHDHARLYDLLIERLEASPRVRSAGVMTSLPASGSLPNYRLELDGDESKLAVAGYVATSGGAFEALDVPLLRGRLFDGRDGPEGEHVALVSESFADRTWPGEDPIGRQVTGGGMDGFWSELRFATVVGVVGDVRVLDLAEEPYPTVYFPYSQRPSRIQFGAQLVVEGQDADAEALAAAVRAIVQDVEPDIPLRLVRQEEIVADALASRRFLMLLLGSFSVVGWLLAAVGIYGVVSYSVARRTREMGIRVALGAAPSEVGRMVVGSSMRLVAGGIVAGIAGAVLASRALGSALYEVRPGDPLTVAAVVLLLVATAAAASWIPARAGTRTDPMVTMRAE